MAYLYFAVVLVRNDPCASLEMAYFYVAEISTAIWADIFLANDLRLIESLERFLVGLEKMKNEIAAGNYSEVKRFLERGKSVRDHFSSITKEL